MPLDIGGDVATVNPGRYPLTGFNLVLRADIADGTYDIDNGLYIALGVNIQQAVIGLGEGGYHDRGGILPAGRQIPAKVLPELFGYEGHEGVQQTQGGLQHVDKHR